MTGRRADTGPPRVRDLLGRSRARLRTAGIAEFRVEAELLVQYALRADAAGLFASLTEPVAPGAEARLATALERRAGREPLAYITGSAWFYGREFHVTPDVLIPRPETELLVERAVKFAAGREGLRVADIGTGSGVLAITLALELAGASVDAVDISAHALDVARDNAARLGVDDRINWYEGDLAEPLPGPYDIVVANLPYVRADTLSAAAEELRREPEVALLGGVDGLDVIRRLAPALPGLLGVPGPTPGRRAAAFLEIDPLTVVGARAALVAAAPDARVRVERDLAVLERCLELLYADGDPA